MDLNLIYDPCDEAELDRANELIFYLKCEGWRGTCISWDKDERLKIAFTTKEIFAGGKINSDQNNKVLNLPK